MIPILLHCMMTTNSRTFYKLYEYSNQKKCLIDQSISFLMQHNKTSISIAYVTRSAKTRHNKAFLKFHFNSIFSHFYNLPTLMYILAKLQLHILKSFKLQPYKVAETKRSICTVSIEKINCRRLLVFSTYLNNSCSTYLNYLKYLDIEILDNWLLSAICHCCK